MEGVSRLMNQISSTGINRDKGRMKKSSGEAPCRRPYERYAAWGAW